MPNSEMKLAVIETSLAHIQAEIREVKDGIDTLKDGFVTKDQFEPVKALSYGLVSVILIAVVGAIIALVLKG